MSKCLLGIVFFIVVCFGGIREDFFAHMKSLQTKSVVESVSQRGLAKRATTIGYAIIKAADYDFNWMLFSGGWFWETDDQYASFYILDQDYNTPSVFNATISLHVYRTQITPLEAAQIDLDYGIINNGNILQNKSLTTFANRTAYYNSYSFVSGSYTWSVDSWSFANSGVTYHYRIFTTVSDWNLNSSYYNLMTAGFYFDAQTLAKSSKSETAAPITYHKGVSGTVQFNNVSDGAEIYIYGLNGRLIRKISGNIWDGLDMTGSLVTSGFYVSTIKVDNSFVSLKILKN